MSDFCAKLVGRPRQICDGFDSAGNEIDMLPTNRIRSLIPLMPGVSEADIAYHVRSAQTHIRPGAVLNVTGGATAGMPLEAVGTAMVKRIEGLLNITTTEGCSCRTLAGNMDQWGIAGCEQRRSIIVDALLENKEILNVSLSKSAFAFVRQAGAKESISIAVKLAGAWWRSEDVTREAEVAGANWLLDQSINDVRVHLKLRAPAHSPVRIVGDLGRSGASVSRQPDVCRPPIMVLSPRPFTAQPNITLLCHCWPHGDNWQKHVAYLEPVKDVFSRKIMGVATGEGCAKYDDVRRAFGDSWEYFRVENDKKLREVATYRPMMQMIKSTNENDVTFCVHTKGTQHSTARNRQVQWWIEAMYETVIYNWRNVLREFEKGHSIAGSFMRESAHFRTRYSWHYSGTFYAFRNAAVFADGIPKYENRWWGTESWPGHHFSKQEAACMFAPNCGHIYSVDRSLELELDSWRKQNET